MAKETCKRKYLICLGFQRVRVHVGRMKENLRGHILNQNHEEQREIERERYQWKPRKKVSLRIARILKLQTGPHLLIFPKQFCQLENKYPNVSPWEPFSFKLPVNYKNK